MMDWIPAKQILTGSGAPGWFGMEYNMNLYRGCCHGCIYCDSRSACYGVEDFDTVRAKADCLTLLENELRRKRRRGVVGTGAMSDPYNPCERQYRLTRGALLLLHRYGFGVSIATKSDLILRDTDVLTAIARHSPAIARVTVTAGDDALARLVEPGVCPSSARFAAVRRLTEAGVFAGLLLMPVLPFIEDGEDNILRIVEQAHAAGARFIDAAFGVTLRQNQREYFYARLDERFPGLRQRYVRAFGNAYECPSPQAHRLWQLFSAACERYGILYRMEDIVAASRAPYRREQLSLV